MTLTPEDHRAIASEVVQLLRSEPSTATVRRAQYSISEFAPICGVSAKTLKGEKYWRRYGGIKRGGRVVFPESARLAIAKGERP